MYLLDYVLPKILTCHKCKLASTYLARHAFIAKKVRFWIIFSDIRVYDKYSHALLYCT